MDNKLGEAINKAIQAHNFDCREEAQAKKREYIELVDSTMRTIIKEEVNAQLPQILPQTISDVATPVIEKNVTESVEAAVLIRSSSQLTSTYEAVASLFEFELTKILIDKMEKNKSYDKADYKKKLYDALVESYNTDKDLFDSYGEVFSLKRNSRSKDKKSSSTSKDASQSQHKSSSKSAHAEEPSHTVEDSCMQQDQEFVTGDNDEQPANKEGRDLSRRYSTSVTKTKVATYDLKWIKDLGLKRQRFYGYARNLTSSKYVYSRRRIIAVTRLKIMKMYDYSHLEEIEVCQDDHKLYTFKEGDFKRLRLQYIEDMLLLLVQQKLTNLTIDERYSLNVALRMFTRLIVIQRRVEDLQLGVESYQKKLNLTKPDTFRMEYLPMRNWSNLDKKRARVMVQDIDKQLYQRRLMRNLEKFVGGREYGNDLRLLERTI
ncbi:hypothetical protein Tco_0536065 [Tanacetum coccineum]